MKTWEIKVLVRTPAGEVENKYFKTETDDIDREILIIQNAIRTLGGRYLSATFRVFEEGNPSKL